MKLHCLHCKKTYEDIAEVLVVEVAHSRRKRSGKVSQAHAKCEVCGTKIVGFVSNPPVHPQAEEDAAPAPAPALQGEEGCSKPVASEAASESIADSVQGC
jgi:hypothetical protein